MVNCKIGHLDEIRGETSIGSNNCIEQENQFSRISLVFELICEMLIHFKL